MKKINLIKTITVLAVIIVGIAVWVSTHDQSPTPPDKTGGEDKPISIEQNEEADHQKPIPDESENPKHDTGLLILVNKNNYLEENYKPEDLAPIVYFAKDRSAESRFMRAEAAEHFNSMVESAKKSGVEIVMTTAYRSYGFQSVLYNNYVAKYGQAEADKFSAKPGSSEHQTGLAVDVSASSVGYALTDDFDQTSEWKWLIENMVDYGFILRYPKGKTDITGYMYEPWHFRYVGTEVAKIITDEKLALEEYIDR